MGCCSFVFPLFLCCTVPLVILVCPDVHFSIRLYSFTRYFLMVTETLRKTYKERYAFRKNRRLHACIWTYC